jgi:hypothetical protein
MLVVTTPKYYNFTRHQMYDAFNMNLSEFEKSVIVLIYTDVNYKWMIIDESLYYAKGCDFELRYRILIHKVKGWFHEHWKQKKKK